MIDEKLFIERIRSKAPSGLPVVPGSFPVTSFGDPNRARVLTVGINPSSSEFMLPGGKGLLPDGKKRFIDSSVLGIPSDTELDENEARVVLQGNKNYFKTGNHYKWFDDMEKWVLSPLGYSYFDGTAAHVDVLQWATHPVWSGIEDDVFTHEMISPDLELLRAILSQRTYDYVLINGKTVYDFFRDQKLFHLDEQEKIMLGGKRRDFRTGHVGASLMLQWSVNVPHYASGTATRSDLRSYLASRFGRANPELEYEGELPETTPTHICPICRGRAIGANVVKICNRCVERAELKSGERVQLATNRDEWSAIATTSPMHNWEHLGVSKVILEPGSRLWIDGRESVLVMKDPEYLQVWISECEFKAGSKR